MNRIVTAMALAAVLFSARFASADLIEDCNAECGKTYTECIDAITLYDETGVREAKEACTRQWKPCAKQCHDLDGMGDDAYHNMMKQQAEQAEQKKREQEQQEQQENGGIKIYQFNN